MTARRLVFHNGSLFDGTQWHANVYALFERGVLSEFGSAADRPRPAQSIDLNGDILSAGYVDLQVNGGGGVQFNADPSLKTLQRMAVAHRGLGVRQFFPTLITDTPDKTRAAIAAVAEAVAMGLPGIAGLHLEGPHLAVARKGAHDAALIRPMEEADLAVLLAAVQDLPRLKVTIAPEAVTPGQVARLSQAGCLVSIGHSDTDFDTARRYASAGARCVTHLFNAMSQIGNRAPGLAGAALATGTLCAGMIADGVHVHPEVMRLAWQAKRGPGRLFLVSDAMAVAGTDDTQFELGGRIIRRQDGQLRLEDGTLAGADLDLTRAIRVLVDTVGVARPDALAAATQVPAAVAGLPAPRLLPGTTPLADVIRIKSDLSGLVPITA